VSKPLVEDIDLRNRRELAKEAQPRIELRAQLGVRLAEIFFKDGDIDRKGDLLSPELSGE
jgi:hypothetical protein